MKFKTATLKNGLEIVAECDDAAFSTALGFFVNTGAPRRNRRRVGRQPFFGTHGVQRNAELAVPRMSTANSTKWGRTTTPSRTRKTRFITRPFCRNISTSSVTLLADLMRPSLREEDFNTEKQVILEEIKMYDDQPPFGADDKCRAAFFGNHPLGQKRVGYGRQRRSVECRADAAVFRAAIQPAQYCAGRCRSDRFCRIVRDGRKVLRKLAVGRIGPAVARGVAARRFSSASQRNRRARICDHDESGSRPPAMPIVMPPKFWRPCSGDDSGSRLYWDLVDPGLAEHCSLHHHEYLNAGMFLTYMSCDPEYAAENLQRIQAVYQAALAEGITQAELDQAKNKINSRVVLASERPRGRLFTVGANWVQRREYRSVRDDLDAVEAITLKDLAAVQQKYPLTQATTFVVGPLAEVAPAA